MHAYVKAMDPDRLKINQDCHVEKMNPPDAHMGSPRGLEALMIPSSVQSNPLFHIPRASHDIFGHIISNLDHWLQGCLLLTTAYPPASAISCSYLA